MKTICIKASGDKVKTLLLYYVGNSFQLKAAVKGTSAKVIWSSSNNKIAIVNAGGRVTAKKAGKVKISAKVNNVKKSAR